MHMSLQSLKSLCYIVRFDLCLLDLGSELLLSDAGSICFGIPSAKEVAFDYCYLIVEGD